MTVKELINILKEFPEDVIVGTIDEEYEEFVCLDKDYIHIIGTREYEDKGSISKFVGHLSLA